MDIRPGAIVFGCTKDDKYKVIEVINAGHFGIVYKAQDSKGNTFALKTISTALLDDTALQTLKNEGKLASEIDHPNVINIYFFHDGTRYADFPPYMLMEYADGGSLSEILTTRRQSRQMFPNDELRLIFIELASGMKAINEKLVHRDIKPDNILIVKDALKISDFGLSKIVGAATRSQTLKGINHIRYCAPEAWHFDHNTPAMDMYSMGIVFYELATLAGPYDVKEEGDLFDAWRNAHLTQVPEDPQKYNRELPIWVVQLVLKMMSKRPEERYSSWDKIIHRCKEVHEAVPEELNISSLVQRAVNRKKEEEEARLKAEEERRNEERFLQSIKYCFREIISAAHKIINMFNKACDVATLEITEISELHFCVQLDRNSSRVVEIQIYRALEGYKVDDKSIKAWGLAKAPSGCGFNLILIASSPDDLYGQWLTFHVSHNPICQPRDDRPDPFPFEVSELPDELHLLNALHIYVTERKPFSGEMFKPLIEELL